MGGDTIKDKILTFEMLLSCIVGLVSALVIIPITEEQPIIIKILLSLLLFSIIYIWYLHIKIYKQVPDYKKLMPRLASFLKNSNESIPNAVIVNTSLLSNSSIVTLYLNENEIQEYLATAKIINIQDNNIAQIKIIDFNEKYKYKNEEINNNNKQFIASIVVKLSFHSSFVQKHNLGGL